MSLKPLHPTTNELTLLKRCNSKNKSDSIKTSLLRKRTTNISQADMTGIRKSRIAKGTSCISSSFMEIEDISKGIEAQIDPFLTISKVITWRTEEIARQIGIDEAKVKKWVKLREECASKRYELAKLIIDSDGSQKLEINNLD